MLHSNDHPVGLVLLDATLSPSFISPEAERALSSLTEVTLSPRNRGVYYLPKAIHLFARDLQLRSKESYKRRQSKPISFTRLIRGRDQGLFLRGSECWLGPSSRYLYYLISVVSVKELHLAEAGLLTPREIAVAGLSVQGFKGKAIAKQLNISIHTVYDHMKSIRLKIPK